MNEFGRRDEFKRDQIIDCSLQLFQRRFPYSLNDNLNLRVPWVEHSAKKCRDTDAVASLTRSIDSDSRRDDARPNVVIPLLIKQNDITRFSDFVT